MRILGIYSTGELLGGGEISFTLSLRSVQEAGYTVLAVVTGKGPLSEYLTRNEIHSVVASQPPLRKDFRFRYLIQPDPVLLGIARNFRPDVIHCNAIRAALYGQAVAHRLNIPSILHARKTERDPVDRFLLARLDAIICTTEAVRKRFPGWPSRAHLAVLYNPVDLRQYDRPRAESSALRQGWQDEGGLIVGVVGRLSPIKGQQLIVEAAPQVLKNEPKTRFVFLGAEDLSFPGFQRELQRRIEELGLASKFVFSPPMADPAAAYHALDVIAFPTHSEGFGRIIVEAGAARKALVTSDIPVVKEVLGEDLRDLTVPCGNVDALAKRLNQLLADPVLRQETARRLHDHVSGNFGLEAHRRRLCEIYAELKAS